MANRKDPTEKMIGLAEKIAARKGIELSDTDPVRTDFDACRAFLDEHMKPSQKQLDFAATLAKENGVEIPADALTDGRKLSAFIDAHKKGEKK